MSIFEDMYVYVYYMIQKQLYLVNDKTCK